VVGIFCFERRDFWFKYRLKPVARIGTISWLVSITLDGIYQWKNIDMLTITSEVPGDSNWDFSRASVSCLGRLQVSSVQGLQQLKPI
jgi:hypothetical protein